MEIGDGAFSDTDLGGTLVIPAKVTTIGASAFQGTKFTGIDLSRVDLYNATSLKSTWESAFFGTGLTAGMIVAPTNVPTYGV